MGTQQDQKTSAAPSPAALSTFFLGLAGGALAMFLFDPQQGRGRRARLVQKVTLSGTILRSELHALVECVEAVPGVEHVNNELQAHDTPDKIPSLQGEGKPLLH